MATFKDRNGRQIQTTAKLFVKSYYKDAECGTYWIGEGRSKTMVQRVVGLPLSWKRVYGHDGGILGQADTPQKAWMDAARKLEARLAAGEYQ